MVQLALLSQACHNCILTNYDNCIIWICIVALKYDIVRLTQATPIYSQSIHKTHATYGTGMQPVKTSLYTEVKPSHGRAMKNCQNLLHNLATSPGLPSKMWQSRCSFNILHERQNIIPALPLELIYNRSITIRHCFWTTRTMKVFKVLRWLLNAFEAVFVWIYCRNLANHGQICIKRNRDTNFTIWWIPMELFR